MDLSAATRAIGGQFPELAPVHASWLGEGYDSIALDVAPHWVFRFPKRADVEQQLLLELRVLPLLAPHLPLRIPEYRFHGERSPDFPRRFAGYRRIDGQPSIAVDPMHVTGTFVPSLGAFLSRLHSFPTASAIRVGVPRVDMTSFMAETQAEAIRDMDVVQTVASKESADAWCDGIATAPETVSDRSRQVLVHADLAAEHILATREGEVTGVIDWSEISIADRALDLAAMFHWGGQPFANRVLDHYVPVVDRTVLERARFLARCRGAGDVVFGVETGRREYVAAGLRALAMNT